MDETRANRSSTGWGESRRLTEAGPRPSDAAELVAQAQPQNLRLLAASGRPDRAQPPISGFVFRVLPACVEAKGPGAGPQKAAQRRRVRSTGWIDRSGRRNPDAIA